MTSGPIGDPIWGLGTPPGGSGDPFLGPQGGTPPPKPLFRVKYTLKVVQKVRKTHFFSSFCSQTPGFGQETPNPSGNSNMKTSRSFRKWGSPDPPRGVPDPISLPAPFKIGLNPFKIGHLAGGRPPLGVPVTHFGSLDCQKHEKTVFLLRFPLNALKIFDF